MIIRNETESDIEAIERVTAAAFENHPCSRGTEPFIIRALRAAGALTLSLVAEEEGERVGHVAFSPVEIAGRRCGWYGVGPLSVLPGRQRRGIGQALVLEGLSRLRSAGAKGCALVGDPDYYRRFGFRNLPELIHEGIPQKYFLALPLGEDRAQGVVVFHEGFRATG